MNNKLFIFGGRNDEGDFALGDMCVLDLNIMTWIQVVLEGYPAESRWSHVMANVGTKILIFGGLTTRSYTRSGIIAVETDTTLVNQM
mmetsp:Transcript_13522/g.6668  ORF Transcript_13522/g.6668 Transcript_13522/m.6668 type:complete len:87 (-) Transcript_13522:146-406(-)